MGSVDISDLNHFVDILKERRIKSDIKWASRDWKATTANNIGKKFNPEKIKSLTFNSFRLSKILRKISQDDHIPLKELHSLAKDILHEIGYNRKVPILRWLAFLVAKILKKLLLAVYINEAKFLQIKSQMGSNPLLFVPSHKSYCDFILMSYICFNYEVDIPRIAAGMDFQSMTLMGNMLRDACAFFIRRSFIDDELYSAVFSQYVSTLVVHGDAAIEFFIEGTRSRTQKSLMPKYGFLSMTLKPFLTGIVPDITIVPVNLSYDRVLEEVLFAYELLGVPKPKETTRGFLKALSILNENYGNVYVQFGEPISVKNYLRDKVDRSVHGFGSVEMQDITPEESRYIISLAHSIVRRQRELTSLNSFNLVAVVLNDCLLRQHEPPHLDNLLLEVQWLFEVLKTLAPKTILTIDAITKDKILHHLNLHKSLLHLSVDEKVQLSRTNSVHCVSDNKLKGHKFSNTTMDIAIPVLMLQYYVNPCANFLIGICFVAVIVHSLSKSSFFVDDLLEEFKFLCSVFSHEFIFHSDFINEDFTEALNQSKYFRIIRSTDKNKIEKGNNNKLSMFLTNFLNPYTPGYITLIEVLIEWAGIAFSEREILKACQQRLELKLNDEHTVHPANLSLDLLTNALQSFVLMKAVSKEKVENGFQYQANMEELQKILKKLKVFDFSDQYKGSMGEEFSAFQVGTSVKFKEGIPDCWAEYLRQKLRLSQKFLQNYELMHMEDADIVSHLRKYRLYIGQGIPDPWTTYSYINTANFFSNLKNMQKYWKSFKNKTEERCLCCEREYLFECPDKCTINPHHRSCKDRHDKSTTTADSSGKCRCSEIFHNLSLENDRLNQREKQNTKGSTRDGVPSPNASHSGSEGENKHFKERNKFVVFCECFENRKEWDCDASENSCLGSGDHESKMLKLGNQSDKFFKQPSQVYFCPYIKSFYRRKSSENKSGSTPVETKTSVSKEIQTEIRPIKSSKRVQTEKSESKAQTKCTCCDKCFPCSILCKKSSVKASYPAIHSIPNFCFPSVSRNLTFLRPCSFTKHFTVTKSCNAETAKIKKRKKKEKPPKEGESLEGPNGELKFRQDKRTDGDSIAPKNQVKQDLQETERREAHDDLKYNGNFYNCRTPRGALDHLKCFSGYKEKGCIQPEENSPSMSNNKFIHQSIHKGSKFMNFCRDPSLSNLCQESFSLERFKSSSHQKPKYSEFDNLKQINFLTSNIKKFDFSDHITVAIAKETENLEHDISVKEMIERNVLGFVRNHGDTKAQRRHGKLLRNRKRRRKLVSDLRYQDSLAKLPKRAENVRKEVQV